MLCAVQLNREPSSHSGVRHSPRPSLSHFRDSGAIEQDADVVMFIYRDELYNADSPDRGVAELIIAKHRNGQTGTIKLVFLGETTKFCNLARPDGSAPPF